MVFVRSLISFFVLVAILLAQPSPDPMERSKERLLAMSQADVHKYLEDALLADLPPSAVDSITFLALNRESVVVPALLRSLRDALEGPRADPELANRMSEVVAYAASPESTAAVLEIFPRHQKFVGRLLWRSLSYLSARGDPFPVAYRIVESPHEGARIVSLDWVEENVSRGNNAAHLSRSMLSRLGGFVTEADLLSDPFAVRIGESARETLRLEIAKQLALERLPLADKPSRQ